MLCWYLTRWGIVRAPVSLIGSIAKSLDKMRCQLTARVSLPKYPSADSVLILPLGMFRGMIRTSENIARVAIYADEELKTV